MMVENQFNYPRCANFILLQQGSKKKKEKTNGIRMRMTNSLLFNFIFTKYVFIIIENPILFAQKTRKCIFHLKCSHHTNQPDGKRIIYSIEIFVHCSLNPFRKFIIKTLSVRALSPIMLHTLKG